MMPEACAAGTLAITQTVDRSASRRMVSPGSKRAHWTTGFSIPTASAGAVSTKPVWPSCSSLLSQLRRRVRRPSRMPTLDLATQGSDAAHPRAGPIPYDRHFGEEGGNHFNVTEYLDMSKKQHNNQHF